MKKYIDAEWLKQNFNTVFWSQITKTIDSAPSIDIVRCGECKYYLPMQKNLPYAVRKRYCNKGAIKATSPDDFCSYGCRKEE